MSTVPMLSNGTNLGYDDYQTIAPVASTSDHPSITAIRNDSSESEEESKEDPIQSSNQASLLNRLENLLEQPIDQEQLVRGFDSLAHNLDIPEAAVRKAIKAHVSRETRAKKIKSIFWDTMKDFGSRMVTLSQIFGTIILLDGVSKKENFGINSNKEIVVGSIIIFITTVGPSIIKASMSYFKKDSDMKMIDYPQFPQNKNFVSADKFNSKTHASAGDASSFPINSNLGNKNKLTAPSHQPIISSEQWI